MDTMGDGGLHYGEKYFAEQRKSGEFGAKANIDFFQKYIREHDSVIDFGCGGGFYLDAIECEDKIGVEINPVARAIAQEKFPVYAELSETADNWADVVISSHALEHTYDPFDKLKLVLKKLKPGGLAVFLVPCERYDNRYVEDNYDQHLYTWSPLNLGNLFRHAGFEVVSCEHVARLWPPKYELVQKLVGWSMFHVFCKIYGRINLRLTQVHIVAKKPTRLAS